MADCGHESDGSLELTAKLFRSLGEPTRLKILRSLEGGERSVGELVQELHSSQANISKHLRILAAAGILARRVRGTSAYYSIVDPLIPDICDKVLGGLAKSLRSRMESFGFSVTPVGRLG